MIINTFNIIKNHIDGVMVNVLTLSGVDHGFEPMSGQPKTIKSVVYVASPLSMQH
jgi:hypothetical protein